MNKKSNLFVGLKIGLTRLFSTFKHKGNIMAEVKNRENTTKEYATDELGMMADAKEYAKRDFEVCKMVYAKMTGVEIVSKEDEANIDRKSVV